jgi:hypothetical protein
MKWKPVQDAWVAATAAAVRAFVLTATTLMTWCMEQWDHWQEEKNAPTYPMTATKHNLFCECRKCSLTIRKVLHGKS